MLLVCAGYYGGALIGQALRFPDSHLSLIWPPTAILLAALLLAPPRRWWIFLLAVAPVHIVVQLKDGVPALGILSQLVGNFGQALLAAISVRYFLKGRLQLDSFRTLIIFILGAVILAPLRDELAHIARINTIGELAASLAHELNQPLTAILSNAQAAQRFLAADPSSLGQIRAILQDIVNDDNRAGEVIRRVRDLVKKGNFEIAPLDLETILRDVIMLIHSDAILHNVNIVLRVDPRARIVYGDKIQLQQVLLNLLLNAFQAMKVCPINERQVTVRTGPSKGQKVMIGRSN